MMDVEALYKKYGPMVLRRCRSMLKDEEKALDAMQDCFVLVLRHGERLDEAAPSSLLYRMATNICLNVLRSERARRSDGDTMLDVIASSENMEESSEARGLVEWVFRHEDDSTRTMAWLHYVEGLTFEETAEIVGLSPSGVRRRLAGLKARHRFDEGDGR